MSGLFGLVKGKLYQANCLSLSQPNQRQFAILALTLTPTQRNNAVTYVHKAMGQADPKTSVFIYLGSVTFEGKGSDYDWHQEFHKVICGDLIGLIPSSIPLREYSETTEETANIP